MGWNDRIDPKIDTDDYLNNLESDEDENDIIEDELDNEEDDEDESEQE